jgi:DNA-binding FrmR family transcriptional regulator
MVPEGLVLLTSLAFAVGAMATSDLAPDATMQVRRQAFPIWPCWVFLLAQAEGGVQADPSRSSPLCRMIEDDRWCPEIVTQVAPATRALQEVAVGLLNDHLHHCVMNVSTARSSGADAMASLDGVVVSIRQVVRL